MTSSDDATRRSRVIVCEPDALSCDGVCSVVRLAGADVTAHTVAEAGASALRHRCDVDVAIVNVAMLPSWSPDKIDPRATPVITLVSGADRIELSTAISWGVAGIVNRSTAARDLRLAIDCVVDGSGFVSPSVVGALFAVVSATTSRFRPGVDPATILTYRERQIFELLGQGLNDNEAARRLEISTATVRSHISHMLVKMKVRSRIDVQVLARQHIAFSGIRE